MIRTHIYARLALALVLIGVPACTNQSSEQPKAKLTGEYRIVSGERNGAAIDPKELDDAVITIGESTITAYDKERKETFAATYTLETKRKPWEITMTSTQAPQTGVVTKGLIEADKDKVKLVYALPDGKPPTEFKTGEQQQMFVLAKTEPAQRG
ncbi:TIGR03067 domain-containing protein [Nitrospira moscoviensis]|uniref:Lipocalin-like domain-containing protein n=1 Tax=Nitrospira moscoviensis TaxID=42253 RepID=A0A0K2GE98_NITMO|nr:TIGR03067 domain-containing protein [Nitrospira moscoviensis]ALA59278.1 conserved exported protein of unknown function [Nitrospira moscoviensis]